MPYTKLIQSGNIVEIYKYEKRPSVVDGKRRKRPSSGNEIDPKQPGLAQDEQNAHAKGKLPKVRSQRSARRAALDFVRLARANLVEPENPVLCSFTYAELRTDLRSARKDFEAFARYAVRLCGNARDFRYICVPEFQKRGAVHFHALIWGFPKGLVRGERYTRLVASLWGHGYVDLVETDGSNKLAQYLGKYLSKAYTDVRLAGMKAYTASRNVYRPLVMKDVLLSPHYYGVVEPDLSTARTLRETEYSTEWLGRAHYKKLEIQKHASASHIEGASEDQGGF